MNITLIRLLMVATALCGSALATASEPANTPTAPAAAEPVSTPAAPAAPVATAPAPATAETKSKAPAARTEAVPAGYKVKVIDGETRYCRKTTPMGTRFATEVCMTMAQYEEQVRNQNAMRSELTGKQKSFSINN